MAMLRECEQCKKTVLWRAMLDWWEIRPPGTSAIDLCSWDCLSKYVAANPDADKLTATRKR
jgi:hypothetical protein